MRLHLDEFSDEIAALGPQREETKENAWNGRVPSPEKKGSEAFRVPARTGELQPLSPNLPRGEISPLDDGNDELLVTEEK